MFGVSPKELNINENGYEACIKLLEDLLFDVENSVEFDVCMLSYNLIKSETCNDYPFLKKVLEVQTTAGYIINESMYDKLIDLYTWTIPLLTNTKRHWIYALDQIWKLVQPISKWYCFDLRLGKQRPSYSDLGNKWTNPEH